MLHCYILNSKLSLLIQLLLLKISLTQTFKEWCGGKQWSVFGDFEHSVTEYNSSWPPGGRRGQYLST